MGRSHIRNIGPLGVSRSRAAWLGFALAFAVLASGCARIASPEGWAGPVAVEDQLFVSVDSGKMASLDPVELTVIWEFPSGDLEDEYELDGIYGEPVLDGDLLYFGGYDGGVYALNAEDGALEWRFEADDPVIGGVAIRDGVVYVGSIDKNLYALDAATGEELDSFAAGGGIWGRPLIVEDKIYVATDAGEVFSLDLATLEPSGWDAPFEVRNGLLSDPVLTEGGLIIVGGIGGDLHAVDAESGEEAWAFSADNWFWGRPLIDSGTIYAPSLDGFVYALNAEDGEEVWSFDAEAAVRSGPIMHDDALVVIDKNGRFFTVDPETGVQMRPAPIELEKVVGSDPLGVGEEVLVVAQGGTLFTVSPAEGTALEVDVGR